MIHSMSLYIHPLPLSAEDQSLFNNSRLLINDLLDPGVSISFQVRLGTAEGHLSLLKGKSQIPLWKRLAEEIGEAYYPAELMTDSRAVLLGKVKQSTGLRPQRSLEALESSEKKGEGGEGEETGSPKSRPEEESESDESIAGDDYNIG